MAAAQFTPKFMVNTLAPVFKSLVSGRKVHVAAKWAKSIIPHTGLANTDAHQSIRQHIEQRVTISWGY